MSIADRIARKGRREQAEEFSRCDGSAVFAALGSRDDFEATSSAMWWQDRVRHDSATIAGEKASAVNPACLSGWYLNRSVRLRFLSARFGPTVRLLVPELAKLGLVLVDVRDDLSLDFCCVFGRQANLPRDASQLTFLHLGQPASWRG